MLDATESLAQDALTQFFNLSHDIIVIIGINGQYLKISPSFTKELGYTKKELDNTSILDYGHPDNRSRIKQQWQVILDGEVCVYYKSLFKHKKGHFIPIEWRAILSSDEQHVYAIGRITPEQTSEH